MRIKTSDFEIEADTLENVRELLGLVGRRVQAPVTNKGPYETAFNSQVGRLKPSLAESARIESGEATREDIARERLEALGLSCEPIGEPVVQAVSSVETSNERLY